jgi:hypothetical protein
MLSLLSLLKKTFLNLGKQSFRPSPPLKELPPKWYKEGINEEVKPW